MLGARLISWSCKVDILELHGILSKVDPNSDVGRTIPYTSARIFYYDMCQVLRAQQSSLQPAGPGGNGGGLGVLLGQAKSVGQL